MSEEEPKKHNWIPKVTLKRKHIKKHIKKAEGATVRHANKFVIKRWSNIRDVQRSVVLWIFTLGLLILSTGLQLTWNQHSYQTTTPDVGTTYAEAVLGPVDTLNPIYASSSAERSASYLIFSSLLKYDRSGHLGYDLASDIKVENSNMKYVVTVRSDARWQDGAPLTAEDVVFTVDLLKNPVVRAVDSGWSDIGVKLVNKSTVEFTLSSTYAAFEHALTFPVLPKHLLKDVAPMNIRENKFSQNPVGSGPFKLGIVQNSESNPNNKVLNMTRSDDYYGAKPRLLHIQLHTYENTDGIVNALTQKVVNAAVGLSSVDLDRVSAKNYVLTAQSIQSGVYAFFNTKSNLLKDTALRRALQMATDPRAIIDKLPIGTRKLDFPLLGNQISNASFAPVVPDQTGAKSALQSNGWVLNARGIREKGGVELKLSVVTIKNSELERVLEILVGQWRAVGISVETKTVDPSDTSRPEGQSTLQTRNYDVLVRQINIGSDPDVYAYWHSSQATQQGLNFSNYANPISDDALLSARARVEPALRNAKYVTFVKQWLSDVPAVGLYQSTIDYVASKNTHTFNKSNTLVSSVDRYADVVDWSVGNRTVYKTP
ncbi:hypothetical protein HGB25_03490 [Candidatus Saccharibacteria bacterium]|nr:hypothetical protein [Candidatus Saccharibacteria bacterium]